MNRAERRRAEREQRRPTNGSTHTQPKVCIATLHRADEPPVGAFFKTWSNLLTVRPVDITETVIVAGSLIDDGRNTIARRFLASSADWLWTCDSDMDPDLDTVPRLLAHADPVERPIVGALCFKVHSDARLEPTLYQLETAPHHFLRVQREWDAGALVQVAATGAACLLIHRSVFEKLSDPWFGPGSLAGVELGEDTTFCLAAGNAGFPIFVATDVHVGHVKPKSYGVDDWHRQQAELGKVPTFVVVPVREAGDPMPVRELSASIAGVIQIPNDEVPASVRGDCPSHTLHKWNKGLAWARGEALAEGFDQWNVLVLNDDVVLDADVVAEQLSEALRSDPAVALAYPNVYDLPGEGSVITQTDDASGQTHSGYCFMVKGESAIPFDERYVWHYGDSDYERKIHAAGKKVALALDCKIQHLHPNESTVADPRLIAQAVKDEALFAREWKLDPSSLFWAQHPELVDGSGHVGEAEVASSTTGL